MLRLIPLYVLIMSSIGEHVQCGSHDTNRSVAFSLRQQSNDLTRHLCGVSRPSSAHTPANKTCSTKEVGESILVLLDAVLRREMKSCRHIVDPMRSWKGNVGCALLTFTILRVQALMKHLLSGPELHNVVDMLRSSHSLTAKVHHSRSIIENCNLKQVSSELYRGNSSGPNGCRLLTLSKTLLFFVTHSKSPNPTRMELSQAAFGCWEPELEKARLLLAKPGKWDIDDKCIDALQAISAKVFKLFITRMLEHARVFLSKVVGRGKRRRCTLLSWLHAKLLTLMAGRAVLQRHVYPLFKKMKEFVRRRNQVTKSSKVLASCRGLRGPKSQVRSTVLNLLALVVVHYARSEITSSPRVPFIIASLLVSVLQSKVDLVLDNA
eukprot:scpid80303/ scgid4344/ 